MGLMWMRVTVVLLMLGAGAGIWSGRISAQTREQVIEGAKKEGKVVWYASLSLEDLKRMSDAFEKKYPFIKVDPFRASG
jgi:iron(III) transport system substrate-binding protein